MDTGKLREGGVAACLAVALVIVWLLTGRGEEDVTLLGALLAGGIALWRIASGLTGSGTRD